MEKSSQPAQRAARASGGPTDAIALLTEDHEAVERLFAEYEEVAASAGAEKEALASQICMELTIHTQIEEEIFYPAVRAAIGDEDLVTEAQSEHDAAKDLIAQLESMDADDEDFDTTMRMLADEVSHHVEEEQDEMFPEVRDAGLDLAALGAQLQARKDELRAGSIRGRRAS